MDAGRGFHKISGTSSQSSGGGRSHRRGNYKQMHEDWMDLTAGMLVDNPRPPEQAAMAPWFTRTHTQSSVATSFPAHGGFMLATNLSSTNPQQQQQQQQPPSQSSSSSSHTPHIAHPTTTFSVSPSNSSCSQPLGSGNAVSSTPLPLWGEVRGENKEREDERHSDGEKWPSQSLWQEEWQAVSIVCSVPRLYQHPPLSQSPIDQTRLPSFLDHPRDRQGNNPILHSTDLQQHIRDVEHISLMSGPNNFRPSDLPLLPEQFGSSKVKRTTYVDPLKAPPSIPASLNLDPTSVALLLRKSAAAICCNVGYHSTSLRALDTLADVMGNYICQLSKQLTIHKEQQQQNGGHITSQDPLERSLWNSGVQGKAELDKYWKTEVMAGMKKLQEKVEQLHEPPVPSPLPPPPPPSSQPLNLSLSTSWLTDQADEKVDDEINLDEALNADMAIVAPASTPDPGGVHIFLPDVSSQDPEGFVLLTPDLPVRKRLRTSNSFTEST